MDEQRDTTRADTSPEATPQALASSMTKADLQNIADDMGLTVKGTKEEIAAEILAVDFGPYYEGMWHDIPNYKCPECDFRTLDGSDAVTDHIRERHMAAPTLHPGLFGPDGKPL